MTTRPPSKTALVAIAALGLCGYVGGWLILVLGGFHHAVARYTSQTTFVDGAPAMAMAALFFVLAAIGVSALLQARACAWPWHVVGWAAVVAPPLFYAAPP